MTANTDTTNARGIFEKMGKLNKKVEKKPKSNEKVKKVDTKSITIQKTKKKTAEIEPAKLKKIEKVVKSDGKSKPAPAVISPGKPHKKKNRRAKEREAGKKMKPKKVKLEKSTKPGNEKQNLVPAKKVAKKINMKKSKKPQKAAPAVEDDGKELVAVKKIQEGVSAFRSLLEKTLKDKKSILDPDFKYCIQVCCFKIPQCPERLARMELPHSLIDETDDVCLFVKDLEKGRKTDPQPTIDYFREQLDAAGIKSIKTIMPVNQLMLDYSQYEMKMKLCNSYDMFLADARVAKRIFKPLGKHFIERKKTPAAVLLNTANTKHLIEKALRKVTYKQVNTGDSTAIYVAKHNMNEEKIVQNIAQAIKNLRKDYPGSWENIKAIYLKAAKNEKVSIPLYVNLESGDDVPVPVIIGPKELTMKKKQKEINKLLPSTLKFTSAGDLAIVKNAANKKHKAEKKKNADKVKQKKADKVQNSEAVEGQVKLKEKKTKKSKKGKAQDEKPDKADENNENLAEEVKEQWEQLKKEGKHGKKNKDKKNLKTKADGVVAKEKSSDDLLPKKGKDKKRKAYDSIVPDVSKDKKKNKKNKI